MLSGKPNAHLSFRCGTSAAVSPAAVAGWNRVLSTLLPQPFHCGPVEGSLIGGFAGHWFGMSFASPLAVLPMLRPGTAPATSLGCVWVSLSPTVFIGPVVSAA